MAINAVTLIAHHITAGPVIPNVIAIMPCVVGIGVTNAIASICAITGLAIIGLLSAIAKITLIKTV